MDQLKLKKWHVLIKRIKVAADAVAATLASGSAGSLGYIFATKMGFVAGGFFRYHSLIFINHLPELRHA
jgi:hypothetical protein